MQDFVKNKFDKLNKRIDVIKKSQKQGLGLDTTEDKGEIQTSSNNPLM